MQQCENNGQAIDLYNLVQLAPIPAELVKALRRYPKVVLAEDAIAHGSVGTHLDELLAAGYHGIYRHRGLPTTGIDHASVPELQKVYGLAAAELADFICG